MENRKQDQTVPAQNEAELNLSDFALFLSVMKNREAYESTLSIIMDHPQMKLKEVRVEEVVLNRSGKRAIRLDAWALDDENVQYNTEMENDLSHDDVRKRSRFYQGLLDTPILKSGKTTRYKYLPSTVITFITKEDIFGRDLAKYTFTEQCEEVAGLHLEDGTTKIFLNMSSKNGRPELVSLLQYMKQTSLDNPEIIVKDERIVKLDAIVSEVKQSEEWEAVRMSILSIGIEQGIEKGIAQGIEKGIEQGIEKGIKKGIKKGRVESRTQDILIILSQFGTVPENLRERILREKNMEVLEDWLIKAVQVRSTEAFEALISKKQ